MCIHILKYSVEMYSFLEMYISISNNLILINRNY